jgi:hypothetical protein
MTAGPLVVVATIRFQRQAINAVASSRARPRRPGR